MAINYEKVGWDTTKYVNPSRMNKMDDAIKAACDKADAHDQQIDAINSNLEQLKTYGDKVLIGQYDGKNLYQRVFTFQHIDLPRDTNVVITSYFVSQSNIVDLSVTLLFSTATICNSMMDVIVEGTVLYINQRITNYSQDATIIVKVKYWDN